MSSSTTRTGLLPTPKRQLKMVPRYINVVVGITTVKQYSSDLKDYILLEIDAQKFDQAVDKAIYPNLGTLNPMQRKSPTERLPPKFEAVPMSLSLRPFGGVFNPFAKGCSVLCNHPAPTAVKDIIHQMKSTLTTDVKNAQHHIRNPTKMHAYSEAHDHIPEDLFRRYTDTDSRPLTPSPTVTSVQTRTSAGSFLNNRRCITPELGKNEIIKRKKIILDLRRSHSQETLYWKPSSDMSQSATDGGADTKPKSAGAYEEKKAKRQKPEDQQRPKSSLAATTTIPEEGGGGDDVGIAKKAAISGAQTCINEHQLDDEDVRRGKKRKKIKTSPVVAPTTATFHLSEDPETQVGTLGPDSVNPSTRPSLIPNAAASLLPNKDKRESEPVLLKGSFLTDDAFQALKTELDVDVIENTFGRYLNRALREAIKYIPPKPKSAQLSSKPTPTEIKEKISFSTQTKMPRKFSKSATRFDVPLDLKSLEQMSVLEYLSHHVWVSRQRKQLYKRSFLKYVQDVDESAEEPAINMPLSSLANSPSPTAMESSQMDDVDSKSIYYGYRERVMPIKCLAKALEDALEFHGTKKNINAVLAFLADDMEKSEILDFRTWCGIVSFAERLALDDPTCTDSCDELEKADFNSMEQRLDQLNVAPLLKQVFEIIRRTHNLKY